MITNIEPQEQILLCGPDYIDKIRSVLDAGKWQNKENTISMWNNAEKLPDWSSEPYIVDCIQCKWFKFENETKYFDTHGCIDILHDRVYFTSLSRNSSDSITTKLNLVHFMNGVSEETMFQYEVTYGSLFELTINDIENFLFLAQKLVPPDDWSDYTFCYDNIIGE